MESMIYPAKRGGPAEAAAFDDFEVIAFPLPNRGDRSFPGRGGEPGVTYGSHELRLGRRKGRAGRGSHALLMVNGSGAQVVALPEIFDYGAMVAAWLELPERVLYATLYSVWEAATRSAYDSQVATARKYSQAFADKRLKVKRYKGTRRVEIVPIYSASAEDAGGATMGELPGPFRTPEDAFAAAKLAHPDAKVWKASPL